MLKKKAVIMQLYIILFLNVRKIIKHETKYYIYKKKTLLFDMY